MSFTVKLIKGEELLNTLFLTVLCKAVWHINSMFLSQYVAMLSLFLATSYDMLTFLLQDMITSCIAGKCSHIGKLSYIQIYLPHFGQAPSESSPMPISPV